jgi:acyl carrier protein
VWREVLNVDEVGRYDNFFDLGANSLRVMQANGKLRQALGREISLVEMFHFTTVSALAEHLAKGVAGTPGLEEDTAGHEPSPPLKASLHAGQERARARGEAMQRRRGARPSSG